MAVQRILVSSPSAFARLGRALGWLEAYATTPSVVVGPSGDAVNELLRAATVRTERGALFGVQRFTLGRLAATLAAPDLVREGRATVGPLGIEALAARVVHALHAEKKLGRFAAIGDRPGLPRALARTLREVRHALVEPRELDADLAVFYDAFEAALAHAKLADRALVFRFALEAVRAKRAEYPLVETPLLFADVKVESPLERELVAALTGRSPDVLATVPAGDERTRSALERALGVAAELVAPSATSPTLARLQASLFVRGGSDAPASVGPDVAVLSAPGESRECVEIARMIRREAEKGMRFNRIAILPRSAREYRGHLEEALRRADIPVHFAEGAIKPDPAGRAFLSLLACAAEGLSAKRFAEYLSLGEVPNATPEGAPPPPAPRGDRWVLPDEELLFGADRAPEVEEEPPVVTDPDAPVTSGTLRAPWRWERLLVEAAVIGGRDRWARRLKALRAQLTKELHDVEDHAGAAAERAKRSLADLETLERYALPLIGTLADLPQSATWGEWLDLLGALATQALRKPDRVIGVMSELTPMSAVGPVELSEVRLVLTHRLTDLLVAAKTRVFGCVYVAAAGDARGLSFETVFVPGLAEKIFPQKVLEDPILRDAERSKLEAPLPTNRERVEDERLALRLAIGAARGRVVLSYPRFDIEQARPRTPSFYGLEVLRAAEGTLPGFDELARRAERACEARLGWPAPLDPKDAIDDAEYDLAFLDDIFRMPASSTKGRARFLLSTNKHLARALRFRAVRWMKRYHPADGLVNPIASAKEALAKHATSARSFSPTALQNFAACPYRFFLQAVLRLKPREEPEAIEELDPLQRGSLVHDVQFQLHNELRTRGLLPVTIRNVSEVRVLVDAIVDRVCASHEDDLAPAIERVWKDGVVSIKSDMREWLRRAAEHPEWVPTHFELSFGIPEDSHARDPMSQKDPVSLDAGILLRGSIDLVERGPGGMIRATDYKTGRARAKDGAVIGGGEVLQPVFYALALEKIFAGQGVAGGRLYYSTFAGGFSEVMISLDEEAREGARRVARAVSDALEKGFLPASPKAGACEYCDYRVVCGPYEEMRIRIKEPDKRMPLLADLRKQR